MGKKKTIRKGEIGGRVRQVVRMIGKRERDGEGRVRGKLRERE